LDAILSVYKNRIENAKAISDLVGPNDDGRTKRLQTLRLALHPDKFPAKKDQTLANRLSARLNELVDEEKRQLENKFEVASKTRIYSVNGIAFTGNVANLYNVTYERDGALKSGLLKIARNPTDNDLLEQEAAALKAVRKEPHHRANFYPRLEESFIYRDVKTSIDRRANMLRRYDDFISLAEVRRYFPNGIDARDLAWMWRRVLTGVSLAHEEGFVHGSLTPAQLVGWGNSVEIGGTVKLLGDSDRRYYPPEIFDKAPVDISTDLYTVAKTFLELMDRSSPGYNIFRRFVAGTTYERQKTRPQHAGLLLLELDEILERLYGPRTFREFKIPIEGK
jgi:serine/threonine protein kinase